jgi:5-methylcytosine-specific restriction endonuclease McrA
MSPSLRKKIYERDKGICCQCGELTRFFNSLYDRPFDKRPKAGSVDHIVPVSKGGTNEESNLRWMCRSCNCSRGAKE